MDVPKNAFFGCQLSLLGYIKRSVFDYMSNLIKLRMPGPRRVSVAQLEELVAWMESHPLQARATQCNSPQAKQLSHRLWDELTSRLNAVGEGVTKTVREWRQMGFDDSPPPPVPLLELPLSWPITPDPPETPSTSSHPTPDVAERDATHPANTLPTQHTHTPSPDTQPSPRTASQARPPKRKHVAEAADADDDRPHSTAALSRRVLQWESRRIREEEMRRALEERRLALEEQRLEEDRAWRREQLEEDRAWRRDLLSAIQRLTDALGQPPRPPSPFA